MRITVLVLVLALAGGAIWLLRDDSKSPAKVDLDTPISQSDRRSSEDVVSSTTGSNATEHATTTEAGDSTTKRSDTVTAPTPKTEMPMTPAQQSEVRKNWDIVSNAALSDEEFLALTRDAPQAFGDLPEPDTDAIALAHGFRALVASRIGIGVPGGKRSVAEGNLPYADSALRALPEAVRAGHVKFAMELGPEGKDGPLPARAHTDRWLYYRCAVGNKIVDLQIDRRATGNELLDHFDPQRREYR